MIYLSKFSSGNDPTNTWKNANQAWDGNEETSASRQQAPGRPADLLGNLIPYVFDDCQHYLLFTDRSDLCPDSTSIIKVEVGVRHYDSFGVCGEPWLRLSINVNGNDGITTHDVPGNHYGEWDWVDVTEDVYGPYTSPIMLAPIWTPSDVDSIQARVWVVNSDNSPNGCDIYEVAVRVTYE